MQAAALLIEEGRAKKTDFPAASDGYRPPAKEFIDGIEYDGRQPNAYLEKFAIGLKGNQKASTVTSTN
jgi:nitrate/nitrite transport system substrate-binding protein